jgi:hypothetical protein
MNFQVEIRPKWEETNWGCDPYKGLFENFLEKYYHESMVFGLGSPNWLKTLVHASWKITSRL